MEAQDRAAGSAFIALSGTERAELSVRLQMSKLERCPIPKLRFPDAQWTQPQLRARVRAVYADFHVARKELPRSFP
jgi:hypothetical protein